MGKKGNPRTAKTNQKYILQLYVNGSKSSSARAIRNATKFCEEYLEDENYKLEIINLHEHPLLVIDKNIIAIPTLVVNKLPDVLKKFIGDLSEIDHFLVGMNLKKVK